MRYKLDSVGYVLAVSFGCYLDNCAEYTGAVPSGYKSLDDWATNACIQAYYIDQKGNLTLDSYRKNEIEKIQAQEAIDNAPVLKRDLEGTQAVLDSQYVRVTEEGKVLVLKDIKTIAPRLKITGVNPYEYDKLSIYTQGKNMLPCDAVSCVVTGVTFTKNMSGSISILGTATKDIEYTIADGGDTPIFALKADRDYYLNLGGLECELKYFDGETTAQQYVGKSGLINLPKNIEVTQVVVKIPVAKPINITFYPQLEVGDSFTPYEEHKCKTLDLDLSSISKEDLLPSDTLYAEDTLYPGYVVNTVDYIIVEEGKVIISVNDEERVLCNGVVGVFSDYNTIYSTKDVVLEMEYSDNMLYVDDLKFLQGKSTTSENFKVLNDGSIEARNGFFKGWIEADDGYFSGRITGGSININNRFFVDRFGDVTLPDTASLSWGQVIGASDEVTFITKNMINASYIKALNLTVGKEIQMGSDAKISWYNVTNQPKIPTDTGQLTNGAGYQNASQVTTITKNTVTTAYVNALGITAGSVRAENITGSTISSKTIRGGEIRSNNYSSSSSAYTCGGGMRIDLNAGDIWWANGSIRASYQKAYFSALEASYLNINWKTALSTSGSNLVLGGGFGTVKLASGATVTSLAEKKENIMPCLNALSAIQNSDIYYFNYKNDGVKRDDMQKVGFIIGDGYNLDSRLLSKEGDAIDICNAIGLNWRATQQLYEKLKKQQEKIEEILSMLNQS